MFFWCVKIGFITAKPRNNLGNDIKVVYNINMKKDSKLKTVKGLRLNTEIVKAVEDRAKQEHRSFTNMVEVILSEYLSKNKAA
jgi:hypothetical protein